MRKGSISLTEGDSEGEATLGDDATSAEDAIEVFLGSKDAAGGIGLALLFSMSGSTCCVVELKSRARIGKRKVV